jgi:hypothetical protein
MKNNLSYYRHDVNSHNHWKFKALRKKFGWDGEGKFWALNNIIAAAEGCRLNLSDEDRVTGAASEIDMDEADFLQFVSFLVKPCKLIKEHLEGETRFIITSDTQDIFEEVSSDRIYQREWKKNKKNSKLEKLRPVELESNSNLNGIELESGHKKEEKSIVNKSKEDIDGTASQSPASEPVDKRKKRKVFIPPTQQEAQIFFVEKVGKTWGEGKAKTEADEFFDHYTGNGWIQGKGKPIVDWQAAARNWIRREREGAFSNVRPHLASTLQVAHSVGMHVSEEKKLDKTAEEINYLYELYLEDQSKVTVISIEQIHYDYLKKAGKINFNDQESFEIKTSATAELIQKKIETSESNTLRFMKKYGVLKFFKQESVKRTTVIFPVEQLKTATA